MSYNQSHVKYLAPHRLHFKLCVNVYHRWYTFSQTVAHGGGSRDIVKQRKIYICVIVSKMSQTKKILAQRKYEQTNNLQPLCHCVIVYLGIMMKYIKKRENI